MASCVNRRMAANYRRIAGAGGGGRTGGRGVRGDRGENLPPSHKGTARSGSREAGGREAGGGEAWEYGNRRTETMWGTALSWAATAVAKLPPLRQGHADPEGGGEDACEEQHEAQTLFAHGYDYHAHGAEQETQLGPEGGRVESVARGVGWILKPKGSERSGGGERDGHGSRERQAFRPLRHDPVFFRVAPVQPRLRDYQCCDHQNEQRHVPLPKRVPLLLPENFPAAEAARSAERKFRCWTWSQNGTRAAAAESHPQYAAAFACSGFAASTDPVAFTLLQCSSCKASSCCAKRLGMA